MSSAVELGKTATAAKLATLCREPINQQTVSHIVSALHSLQIRTIQESLHRQSLALDDLSKSTDNLNENKAVVRGQIEKLQHDQEVLRLLVEDSKKTDKSHFDVTIRELREKTQRDIMDVSAKISTSAMDIKHIGQLVRRLENRADEVGESAGRFCDQVQRARELSETTVNKLVMFQAELEKLQSMLLQAPCSASTRMAYLISLAVQRQLDMSQLHAELDSGVKSVVDQVNCLRKMIEEYHSGLNRPLNPIAEVEAETRSSARGLGRLIQRIRS
jgi:hypothetical protein